MRVRDGAKLVVPAKQSGDGTFVAKSGGVEYMVTAKSLVLSEGNKVIREEPMVDFHGPPAPAPSPSPSPSDANAHDTVAATIARRKGWRRVSRRSSAHQR